MRNSLKYLIATTLLFLIEFFIAVFINDNFIRPYIGDILVIPLIFCFLKIFIKNHSGKVAFSVFLLGLFTEIIQLFNIPTLLNIDKNSAIGIIIGSTFDMKDIVCYLAGTILILLFIHINSRTNF